MIRVSSLLFAAMLITSASAFAADTPDPNAKGEPPFRRDRMRGRLCTEVR